MKLPLVCYERVEETPCGQDEWNDNEHKITGRTGDDVLAEDALTEDGFVTVRVKKEMQFYSKREFQSRLPNLDKIKSNRFPPRLAFPLTICHYDFCKPARLLTIPPVFPLAHLLSPLFPSLYHLVYRL